MCSDHKKYDIRVWLGSIDSQYESSLYILAVFFLWQLRVVGINHNSPELQLFSFLQKRLYDLVKYEGLTEPNHDVRIQCESEQEPGLQTQK